MARHGPLLDEAVALSARARSLCVAFGFGQRPAPTIHAARPRESIPPLVADVTAALTSCADALTRRRRDADSEADAAASEATQIRAARPVSTAGREFWGILGDLPAVADLGCGCAIVALVWPLVALYYAVAESIAYRRRAAEWPIRLSEAEAAEDAAQAARN